MLRALLHACKNAYWSLTIGLLIATSILVVVTSIASNEFGGLEPRIRAKARILAFWEGVDMCELGPIDHNGYLTSNITLKCAPKREAAPRLSSLDEVGHDGLPEYASLLAVLFDCGFIDSVYTDLFLEFVLGEPDFDNTPVGQACRVPESQYKAFVSSGVAYTANTTSLTPFDGSDVSCAYLAPELQGPMLPLEYPGNRSSGPNRWTEFCGKNESGSVVKPDAVTIHAVQEDTAPWMADPRGLFMLRMVITCHGSNNRSVYFTVTPSGKPYSTQCINANANRLSQSFAKSVYENPCVDTQLDYAWSNIGDYTCRQGVRVNPITNWEKWMTIYNRVKADFPARFLGIARGYENMYAIYTGLVGASFGAGAAAIAAFFISVWATMCHLCWPTRISGSHSF
jgi:hypothetical protein